MFSSAASQVSSEANYIESCFSTYLYAGNSSTQTITNGIDLSGKGGLVWTKSRNAANDHRLYDTARGAGSSLVSNLTDGNGSSGLSSFDATGFTLSSLTLSNFSSRTYASWTFRKQAKFFDVVTWTGNGATSRTLSQSIGGTVGCVMVKKTSSTGNWIVWHRTFSTAGDYIILNSTAATQNDVDNGISTTSSTFTVGYGLNVDGETYVAYLFAHNAGGFGLTGTDNVISCDSYTGGTANIDINIGFEPQFVMMKSATGGTGDWLMFDTMRGLTVAGTSGDNAISANTSATELDYNYLGPTATGFKINSIAGDINAAGKTYIYIAIRRGPMKVPTDATKVFAPIAYTGNGSTKTVTGLSFPPDLLMGRRNSASGDATAPIDRLRGVTQYLYTSATTAEQTTPSGNDIISLNMDGFTAGPNYNANYNWAASEIVWNFRRAPSFFDEVCYTGTGATSAAFNHNLGAVPEMMIVKSRSNSSHWMVYTASQGNTKELQLERTNAVATNTNTWGSTTPTSTQFTVGCISGIPDTESTNDSGYTYVAYLFATCPGVSKVGSYTGTGATQTISCGFTGGARFVLIKRTDSTGDWYVWDTARGMVSGTDPSLLLNSTAAEVNANSVYTTGVGFQIVSTAAGINASGGSYIYLAIA